MAATLQDVSNFPESAELSPKVHRVLGLNPSTFTGPGTNTYLVGMDGGKPLLLDTGGGVPGWLDLLRRHLKQHGFDAPARCIMTHAHPDHIGGAEQLNAAFPGLDFHKQPWPGVDDGYSIQLQPMGDGDIVSGDGYTLRAVFTPGHAPDHLCFYLQEEKALFSGDVVLGVGTTVIPQQGGNLGQYLKSLRRLQSMELSRIYPAHGPVIENPREKIAYYISHRLEREAQILDRLHIAPQTVLDLVRHIYRDYPTNLHAAAGQSVKSHLDKLREEKRVSEEVGAAPTQDTLYHLTET